MATGANGRPWPETSPERKSSDVKNVPAGLRIAGLALRALFMACLLVLTVRVAMPQNETLWTAYDTPADLVRVGLGLVVGVGILIQLFTMPKDANGYRTWVFLGLAAVPFVLICIVAVW